MEIKPQNNCQPTPETLEFAEPPVAISLNDQQPPLKQDLRRDTTYIKGKYHLPRQMVVQREFCVSPIKLNLKSPESKNSDLSLLPSAGVWENDSKIVSNRFFQIPFPSGSVSDRELRNPRLQVGLTCVGFGALGLVCLLLYTRALHPEFDWVALVSEYWYPYVGCASLGVAGLMMLGRESLRIERNSTKFE
jgi:hypothetical protein